MMHHILAGTVFVAMVLIPCAIAMFHRVDKSEGVSESDVLDDGFI